MAIRRRVPVLPGLLLFITSIAAGQGAHFQNAGGEHTGQKTGVGLLIERPRGIPNGVTSRVAAFAVTSNADSGEGTLRKAIKDANASGAPATITFDLPAGARTIQPLSFLPQIRVPVTIDGTTQSGYSGTPIVELNGTFAGLSDGLELFGGNSTIRGLAINGFFGTGIFFDSLGGNVVEGCYIGLNTAGDHAIPNGGNGVYILECAGNRIGGYAPATRNVISSNFKPQVIISDTASHDNLVIGNYIGTDATGLNVMGNDSSDGVVIGWGAYRNMIGGSLPGARNLISGHPWEGVFIRNPGTSQNVVAGNWIGLDGTGYYRLGNGIGVWISEGASDNIIGGHAVLERNAITFNDSAGIIIDRSFGPTLPTDTFTTTRNQILGNGLGVNSQWLGVTNGDGIGILVRDAPGNIIGVPGVMNFITNCISHGIVIRGTDARGTIIQGNYIAKSPIANVVYFGQDPLLSGSGIVIDDAPGTLIGGPLPGARNYIGAVGGDAIAVIGPHATATVIQNNVIGTDATLLENWHAFGNGVFIAADSTTVGGETSDLGNVIAYCKGAGIYDSTGSHNLFRNNSLFENVSYGIDLAPHGITPNDSLDADVGANERQNFPIIDSVAYSPTSMHVRGKLNAHPNADYDIDFFVSPTRHASRFGEGKTLIGSARVTTDGAGFADLNLDLFTAVQRTDFITATATEVSTRNTSEFSRAINDLDTDNDGILDIWESENDGIDVNCDGIIDLNLYDLGASPNHKDIFVEVDAMQGYSPAAEVLRELRIAFNSSPVVNPDRTTGIHLHIDVSDSTLTPVDWIVEPRAWPGVEFLTSKRTYFGNTADRIDANARWILQAKDLVYRYALCVKSISPNAYSGVANVIPGNPGNEFIVSLGQWAGGGTPYEWMGTFMHELGHTLGLQHGGGDSVVYKPNYYSVMNYTFQTPGGQNNPTLARGSWRLMYSHYALPPLNEFQLNEKAGLNPGGLNVPKVLVPYARPNADIANARLEAGVAVDWDGNGDSSDVAPVPIDLTNLRPQNPWYQPLQVLMGYDDWSNIKLGFRAASTYMPFIPGAPPPTAQTLALGKTVADGQIHELTLAEHNHLLTLPSYGLYEPWDDWPKDAGSPVILSNEPFTQRYPITAPDGQGGAFVVWQDFHSFTERSGMRLKAQYLDSSGQSMWPGFGISTDTTKRDQEEHKAIPDGNGGLIVTWRDHDNHAYNVYAQRISSTGELLWGKGAVCVSTSTDTLYGTYPYLVGDGSGGAIIIWQDAHRGDNGLYVQHVTAGGVVQWTPGGVRMSSSPMSFSDIASDDSAGAYVSMSDTQDPYQVKCYVQRVGSDGTLLWQSPGVRLSVLAGSQFTPAVAADGTGGAIVAWNDYRSGSSEIFAQRMTRAGGSLWGTNGIPVTSGTGNSWYPRLLEKMNGSSIIAWFRGTTFWMQKLGPSGQPAWQANGVLAGDTVNFDVYSNPIVSDGAGGAVFPFITASRVVSAQRIDSTGARRWGPRGVLVYGDAHLKDYVSMATDGRGGGLIAWENGYPNPYSPGSGYVVYDILAQKVNGLGGFGSGPFTAVVPENAPTPFEYGLDQNYPNPFNPSTTIRFSLPITSNVTVVVYDILGRRVKVLVDQPKGAGVYTVVWDGKNESGWGVASGVYFLMMRAEGLTGGEYLKTVKALLLR